MPLQVGPHTFTVAVPSFDLNTGKITYTKFTMYAIQNGGDRGFDLQEVLNTAATLNAQNPLWNRLWIFQNAVPFFLTEIVNAIPFHNLGFCKVTLTDVKNKVDRWWMPSQHGIWGVIRFVNENGKSQFQDIKDPNQCFRLPPGEYSAVEVTVKEGVTGVIDCTPWSGVPPIQLQVDTGPFQPIYNPAPFFEPVPVVL